MNFCDYDELLSYINALRPPEPGHVRVFRGQYRDYGNMQPTGVRVPLRNDRIWRQYCKMLATDMLIAQGLQIDEALSKADVWAYWYYAIVQHYGPGTHLLDVTHSLDVALWFALHEATTSKRIKLQFRSDDPTSLLPALDRDDNWTSYRKWEQSPGMLYIFDVPQWEPQGLPGHGTLVDLARAPDVFTKSARIQAQKGCLIAAGSHGLERGDLTYRLVHSPIPVEWPMTGCCTVHLSAGALFPSPQDDEWYARLLFLPVVPQVSHEQPHWRMGHPVPLSLYIEHLEHSMYAVQFKALQPSLLYPWLVYPALMIKPDAASYEKAAPFLQTVPILLEAPIFALQPDADDKNWNQELLVEDLPEVLGVADLMSGETLEPELLTNVLFELSPLECVGWTNLLKAGAEMIVPRAVHLVRVDELKWRLQLFLQDAPNEQVYTLFVEAASVRFDRSSRRFHIKESARWKNISTNPAAARGLFGALAILRDLSSEIKPRASIGSPLSTDDDASADSESPGLAGALAVMKRAPAIQLGVHYFVLRDPKTNEPYTGSLRNGPHDPPAVSRSKLGRRAAPST